MATFEFEYTEIDGLLYPNIEIDGKAELDGLGKYGRLRLIYLHEQKPEMYRELLLTGKLAEHCQEYDERGYELSEKLQGAYIEKYPLPNVDFMETVRIRTQAMEWAEEILINQLIDE